VAFVSNQSVSERFTCQVFLLAQEKKIKIKIKGRRENLILIESSEVTLGCCFHFTLRRELFQFIKSSQVFYMILK
jgi:hypothetical protein